MTTEQILKEVDKRLLKQLELQEMEERHTQNPMMQSSGEDRQRNGAAPLQTILEVSPGASHPARRSSSPSLDISASAIDFQDSQGSYVSDYDHTETKCHNPLCCGKKEKKPEDINKQKSDHK